MTPVRRPLVYHILTLRLRSTRHMVTCPADCLFSPAAERTVDDDKCHITTQVHTPVTVLTNYRPASLSNTKLQKATLGGHARESVIG